MAGQRDYPPGAPGGQSQKDLTLIQFDLKIGAEGPHPSKTGLGGALAHAAAVPAEESG
jgi:hypothetical protein